MKKFGVDVSEFQTNVNYEKAVKDGGVEFAVIRASFGWHSGQKDKEFENHYKGFKSLGIPVGAYHYSYASTVGEMKKEVAYFLECIKGKAFDLPCFIDIEDAAQRKASRRELTEMVKTWCEGIETAGYMSGVYTGYYWLRDNMYADELIPKYDLWIASWGVERPTEYENVIWQFGGSTNLIRSTNVPGFIGDVDQDYLYKDYQVKTEPPKKEVKEEGTSKETVYTVMWGDTLAEIASKYNTTYMALAEYNNIENPNLIFVGQKIKIPDTTVKVDIKEGDIVKLRKGAKTYNGGSLAGFVYDRKYMAMEVRGDRVVISYDGIVVAAVNKNDLIIL